MHIHAVIRAVPAHDYLPAPKLWTWLIALAPILFVVTVGFLLSSAERCDPEAEADGPRLGRAAAPLCRGD